MTVINPNSISGITSITLPAGADNVLTIHTNDGVERFRIDSTGNIKVGTAATISPDGDLFVTGVCTATTLSGAASGLTGALPAIDGSALTGMASTDNVRTGILDVAGISTFRNTMNVGAAVTISESGIEASGIGITIANINGSQIGGRRNIIINGAMQVAQRGTSTTSEGYVIDRMNFLYNGTDEAPTYSQQSISSSDTGPYEAGFTKYLRIQNGNQTSGGGAADYVLFRQSLEAQNVANSGWRSQSPTSFMTLSFWVKSSVAQTFYGNIMSVDGTQRNFPFSLGSLSANTWTKVIQKIPGNTSPTVDIDNDNGTGMNIDIWPYAGGNYTDSGTTVDTWATFVSGTRLPVSTATWYTTNDATFDVTGMQLEVGSQATPFEHRSFGEELELCKRYYQTGYIKKYENNTGVIAVSQNWAPQMRAAPTITGEQFESQTDAIWSSVEVTTKEAASFYRNSNEICQRWKCDAEL